MSNSQRREGRRPAAAPLAPEPTGNIIKALQQMLEAARARAVDPNTPPTMLPQIISQACRLVDAIEKVRKVQQAADAERAEAARVWETIHLPTSGHPELPDLTALANVDDDDPAIAIAERAQRYREAGWILLLREMAAEREALLLDPDIIAQAERDLQLIRTGTDPGTIFNQWERDFIAAAGLPPLE